MARRSAPSALLLLSSACALLLASTAPDMGVAPLYPPDAEPDARAAQAARDLALSLAEEEVQAACSARADQPAPLAGNETVFVTGANGFLGATLVELLLGRGYSVIAAHRPAARLHLLQEVAQRVGPQAAARLRLAAADINALGALERAVPDGVAALFHVAAAVSFERATEAQRRMVYRANVVGTRNVAAVCRQRRVGRLVHVSTEGVYFAAGREGVADERSEKAAARTNMAYLHTKLLAEYEVARAVVQDGLWAAIVQPGAIIGRYDYHNFGRLIRGVLDGSVPAVGPATVSAAHATSVAEGVLAAAERGTCGRSYLLGGENMSFQELTGAIARLGGARAPLVLPAWAITVGGRLSDAVADLTAGRLVTPLNAELALTLQLDQRVSSARAVRELGYNVTTLSPSALYSVDGAIAESIAWLKARGVL